LRFFTTKDILLLAFRAKWSLDRTFALLLFTSLYFPSYRLSTPAALAFLPLYAADDSFLPLF
jgi:hypothetical protein